MGYLSPDKKNLTVSVSKKRHEYVAARAARLNWSVSDYFKRWVDRWFDEGCPALTPLEQHLPPIPFKDDPGKASRK